jgi:tetratricopeptide (TPR) repeat protein
VIQALLRRRALVLAFLFCVTLLPAQNASEAERLLTDGHPEAAQKILEQRIRTGADPASDWALLARAQYAQERWDAAIAAAEKANSLAPNVSAYHWWLGRAYGEKADHIGAWNLIGAYRLARRVKSEFERAVALNEKNIAAQSDLAEYYFSAPGLVGGDVTKAERIAQKLSSLSPATSRWIQAHIAQEKRKNYADAERLYKVAIDEATEKAAYWLSLAHFYEKRGQMDAMQQAIGQAAKLKDFDGQPAYDAAEMLLRAGRNFPAALEWLHHYIAAGPHTESAPLFRAHYLLASLLEKEGDKNGAAVEYRQVLALVGDFAPASEGLQRVTGSTK